MKYHHCLFSCQLIDYVFDQISRGVNFLQISKAIAQLHVSEYCRLYTVYQGSDAYQNVLQNSIYAFPSSDQIKDVFLDVYTVRKEQYKSEMENIEIGKMISVDATFKTSKPIGLRRKEDKKVVHQYNNLFIVLNEQREVVQWKLCIGLRHEEIREMIENLSKINPDLETVLADNCCAERQLYEKLFQKVEFVWIFFMQCKGAVGSSLRRKHLCIRN